MTLRVLLAVVLVATLVGCGNDDRPGAAAPHEVSSPEARFGLGPVRDPATTYQPDVLLIEDGPKAIKAASDDGLTWTLDANARGVGDLQPGKIMFATNHAVGRVHELRRSGDEVAVTLAPVDLTEVIKDGTLSVDQPIDFEAMMFQDLPGLIEAFQSVSTKTPAPDPTESQTPPAEPTPTTEETPTSEEPPATEETSPVEEPAETVPNFLRLPALTMNGAASRLPAPKSDEKFKMTVGDWEAEAFKKTGQIGLNLQRNTKSGLRVGIFFKVGFSNPKITANVPVSNGQIGSSSFTVSGINSVSVDISAGADNGVADNTNFKFELPLDIAGGPFIGPGGIPMVWKVKYKFLVTAGFTQKQTTITAHGAIPLNGSLGLANGALVTPTAAGNTQLLDTLEGPTIGVTGFVFASEVKFSVGFGVSVASTGIFAKITASTGLAVGSVAGIGGPALQCKQVTPVVTGAAGVGTEISSGAVDVIKKLLGEKVKLEHEAQVFSGDIYKLKEPLYYPKNELCKTF